MSSPDDQGPVAIRRAHWRELVARASKRMEEPGAADVEVDGEDMSGSWDEPAFGDDSDDKRAAVRRVMASPGTVDLVVAVKGNELLGAMDAARRGATDPRFWTVRYGVPFDLYRLMAVPVRDALPLIDFGSRTTRFRDGRQAWQGARKYVKSGPFRRVR